MSDVEKAELKEAQDRVKELEVYIVKLEERLTKWGETVTRLAAEKKHLQQVIWEAR